MSFGIFEFFPITMSKKNKHNKKPQNHINGLSVVSASPYRNDRYFFPMESGTKLEGIREKLFLDRYSMKDETGEPLEKYPEQTWRRVSKALSSVEKTPELKKEWEKKFYDAMTDFKFNPAGRFLVSAGTGTTATMVNCFVIPDPEDTRNGILETLKQMTELSARGGGVGFNLSTLRPRGSYLKAINGTSSGSVSWANLYSIAAHDIIQQGGTRRGALMIMLWDWHPDVEEFITVKKEQGKILGANLSVCISDAFMEAVEKDKAWELRFPDTDHEKYRTEWDGDLYEWIKKGYPVKTYKTIQARELWDLICDSAWASAEPGVVFLDLGNRMNNTWYFEKNIATNPCGEQLLPAWGVCNLSSINLVQFVDEGGEFDYDAFSEIVQVGVRFLDNAIDSERYPFKEIEKVQFRERRIGLGTIGLADALIKMKIRYGSVDSLIVIEKIFRTLRDVAYEYSADLAVEKGAFQMFDAEKYLQSGFMKTMPKSIREKIRANGIRNALLLTQAPTGKISLLAGVNSGIEPVFSFSYIQKDRLGERTMFHPLYQAWIDEHGKDTIPDYFVTADDLTPEEHVRIQALIQKYTDSSISKTVNAPKVHTVDDVKKLYELAYKSGCKGISYMREGSREGTLIRNKEEKKEEEKKVEVPVPTIWARPTKLVGNTYRMQTSVGTAFITINKDEDGAPVEVFINTGKAGSDVLAMAEALGRLISKSLKFGDHLSIRERAVLIIEQLNGIGGSRTIGFGPDKIASLPDAIARALAIDMGLMPQKTAAVNLYTNGNGNGHAMPIAVTAEVESEHIHGKQLQLIEAKMGDICPDCGNASLINEMGCKTCHGCGYSEC